MATMRFLIKIMTMKDENTKMGQTYGVYDYFPISNELMPVALIGSPMVILTSASNMK